MAMGSKENWTIHQAAKALGKSAKTIRRQIKAGQLPYVIVQGKYGKEYRVTELPLKPEADIPNLALLIIKRLEEENRNLAGELGAAQQKVLHLEGQVKLLTEGKKPWYYKLISRLRKE